MNLVPLALYPGDWLVCDGKPIGFVWDVRGDVIEVRSYHDPNKPIIRFLTRAEASAYTIVPHTSYGIDRPIYRGVR